jgi:hypothetical protein
MTARRYVRGLLRGLHAEPGTILGPNDTNEYMVVVEDTPDGVTVGYAQTGDLEAALTEPEPRSVAEHRLRWVMGAKQ